MEDQGDMLRLIDFLGDMLLIADGGGFSEFRRRATVL
jgi:hypothetical protein